MTKKICAVSFCDRESYSLGYCKAHYYQHRRGKPFTPIQKARKGIKDHDAYFWSFVQKEQNDQGCWKYEGTTETDSEYVKCPRHPRAKSKRSHRVAYFLTHGELPEGKVIDHICHNPWCCNPSHLRAVSLSANNQNKKPGTVRSDSRSGVKNVHMSPNPNAKKPYTVQLSKDNKMMNFGSFATLAEAEAEAIKQRKIHYPYSQW